MGVPRSRVLALALTAAVVLGAAGCGDDDPVSPGNTVTQTVADDIALQVGHSMTVSGPGVVADVGAAGLLVPITADPDSTGIPLSLDTTFTIGNVTYSFTRAFFDAGGNQLAGYDSNATRLTLTSRVFGSFDRTQFQADFGHVGLVNVSGIAPGSDTLVFSGGATDTVQTQFLSLTGGQTRYFFWRGTLVFTNVRVLRDRSNPWPLSGIATWTVQALRLRSSNRGDVEATFNATVTAAFNGTQNADLVVNGIYRYRLNLLTGAITRV